jgi:hypothetical protein
LPDSPGLTGTSDDVTILSPNFLLLYSSLLLFCPHEIEKKTPSHRHVKPSMSFDPMKLSATCLLMRDRHFIVTDRHYLRDGPLILLPLFQCDMGACGRSFDSDDYSDAL